MKHILLLMLFSAICTFVFGQDTLYKRNKEILVVKVQEVGLDEVKYKMIGYETGPTVSIAKDNLIKVVFANGSVQFMSSDFSNPENYVGQKKNAVKVDFLSPLRNNLSFVYERSLKPGRSVEANIGVVGVGVNPNINDDASGVFFRLGYKFINTPDFYSRGMKYSHLLKGGYIRPDVMLGSYRQTVNEPVSYPPYYMGMSMQSVNYLSFLLSFGKQWVYDDSFLFDIFGSLGYTYSQDGITVGYGVVGGGDAPFSASGGIRVGFLFK